MPGAERHKAFAKLPDGYKACLRLAAQGMTSKEIARLTGLKPLTVDTYLKEAKAEIGTPNRREAARAFAAWEYSQKLGPQSAGIAEPPPAPEGMVSIGNGGWRRWVRLPPVGGGYHDLTWTEKTHEALRVAVVGAAVVIGLVVVIAALFDILT